MDPPFTSLVPGRQWQADVAQNRSSPSMQGQGQGQVQVLLVAWILGISRVHLIRFDYLFYFVIPKGAVLYAKQTRHLLGCG